MAKPGERELRLICCDRLRVDRRNLLALLGIRSRMIEKLGESETEMNESSPIQITEHDALFGFALRHLDQAYLGVEIAPRLAVVNQSINPRPKLRVHRLGKFRLPPKIEREIGIELGKNN